MVFNKPQTACAKDFNSSSALTKLSSMSRRTWSASPWGAITHDCEYIYIVLDPFTDRADTIHFSTVVKVYTRRLCSVQNWNASWRRWISCIYTGLWGPRAWWDDHWGMRRAVWRLWSSPVSELCYMPCRMIMNIQSFHLFLALIILKVSEPRCPRKDSLFRNTSGCQNLWRNTILQYTIARGTFRA